MTTTTVDAFYLYWALGPRRRLATLAKRYGLYLPRLRKRSRRENWRRRLRRECGAAAFEGSMDERHLRIAQILKAKAVDAATRIGVPPGHRLTTFPIGSQLIVQFGRAAPNGDGR